MSPATVQTPGQPGAITVAPNGRYAYVADFTAKSAKNVVQYRINPSSGALSAKPVSIAVGGTAAQSVTIAPNGRSAYVTDPSDGSVWQYRVNPVTGKLTPLSPAAVPTGKGPHDLVITPDSKNAYVVTVENDTVAQYRINPATGALSAKSASTATTALHPEVLVLSPDGKNAYITSENDGFIAQYAISRTTGKITPLTPATVKTPPSGSLGLAISPDADLSVKLSAPAKVRSGRKLTYAIKVTGAGPSDAWQTAVTDHLPAETALRGVSVSGGRCSHPRAGTRGGTVRCYLGKLKAGAVWRIQIKVTAKGTHGSVRDKASLTTVTPDPRASNNTAVINVRLTS
jgi:uncharacterized repeat protein (TIGR01451 family)